MDVPARLIWQKEATRYAAYPLGRILPDRIVWIEPMISAYRSWKWVVSWEGWFSESGISESKQAAADKATESWWKNVQTDVPRDVDFEATRIVAQVLVRPVPNSLFSEDGPFLQTVVWHLNNVYQRSVEAGEAPASVVNLLAQLDQEIERRVQAGEVAHPVDYTPSTMRRRRRR